MPETPGKTPITVDELMEEELYGLVLKARGEAAPLSPEAVARRLRAAEDFYEHSCHVFFGERRVKSNPGGRGIPADQYDVEEPAYDYPADFFHEGQWGYLTLNHRPVVSIDQFLISYPGVPSTSGFKIPVPWLQPDKQFGRVQIVPTTGETVTLAFTSWLLNTLGYGTGIPRVIFVDYTAGLSHAKLLRDHQDLLEGVRLRTFLTLMGIVSSIRTGGLGSQSLSQDGQSRTQSFGQGKWGPYSGPIELAMAREQEIRDSWRDTQQSVPIFFM